MPSAETAIVATTLPLPFTNIAFIAPALVPVPSTKLLVNPFTSLKMVPEIVLPRTGADINAPVALTRSIPPLPVAELVFVG